VILADGENVEKSDDRMFLSPLFHSDLTYPEGGVFSFMTTHPVWLIRAKSILYFLFVLVISTLSPAAPDSGWAGEQNQAETFIAHVASFQTGENADNFSKMLQHKGINSWINKVTVPGKGEFSRVYIGTYSSREAAVAALQKLKDEQIISYFTIEVENPAVLRQKGKALPQASGAKDSFPMSEPRGKEAGAITDPAPLPPGKPSGEASPELNTEDSVNEGAPEPAPGESGTVQEKDIVVPDPVEAIPDTPTEPEEEPFDAGKDSSYYYKKGIGYLEKELYDRALSSFSHSIRPDPKFAEGYIKRGDTWYLKGDNDMAINDYNVAISLKPNYSESYLGRGLAYRNLGQVRQAEENLRKACTLGSRDACSLLKSLGSAL